MNIPSFSSSELLWRPLLEAAAQTLAGAVGTYSVGKILSRMYQSQRYDGGMDIWLRGIHSKKLEEGDDVIVDGLLSPYVQLFPGDPTQNARRWNTLHTFPGKITGAQYQALEFFAGSDAALRIGGINGETIVGIYNRYGFVGEGLIGVVPTKLLVKAVPDIFSVDFVGVNARLSGRLGRCPSQHALVAQSIAVASNMSIDLRRYKHLPYLQINSIKLMRADHQQSHSLLGSAWIATDLPAQQYVTEYGYFSDPKERGECVTRLHQSKAWKKASVYFDDISCPSKHLSFKQLFL